MNTSVMPVVGVSAGIASISPWARIIQIAIYIPFLLIAIFSIRTIWISTNMTIASKILLGNLMVAHSCYWLIALFRSLLGQYLTSSGCKVYVYISIAHLYATVLSVVSITGDRFLAIRFPYKYITMNFRELLAWVAGLWIVSILLSLSTFYGGLTEENACHPWFSMPEHGLVIYGVTVVCSTVCVWGASAYVTKEVLRHLRAINSTTCTANTGTRWSMFVKKQMGTTVTFVLISMSHSVMSLPIAVIFPLMNRDVGDERTMMILLLVFGLCSRIVDPFIYIFRERLLPKCCVPSSNNQSECTESTRTRVHHHC